MNVLQVNCSWNSSLVFGLLEDVADCFDITAGKTSRTRTDISGDVPACAKFFSDSSAYSVEVIFAQDIVGKNYKHLLAASENRNKKKTNFLHWGLSYFGKKNFMLL